MTNNDNNISTPRDLSKTHKRAYIVSCKRPDGSEDVFYVKNEWQAEGHLDNDAQSGYKTSYYPCMVSNSFYNQIPD